MWLGPPLLLVFGYVCFDRNEKNHSNSIGHVSVIVGFFFYSLWSIGIVKSPRVANFWYKEVYTAVISTYGIVLYETYGRNGARALNPMLLLKDENIQYTLVSILWLLTTPFFGTLPPFAIFSVLHILSYTRSYLLPLAGHSDKSPLSQRIANFTHSYNAQLMVFASSSEFFVLVRLLFYVLSFRAQAIIQAAAYFAFFKLRFNTSQYTRHVVKTWEVRVDGLLSHPSVPPVIKHGWVNFKGAVTTFVGPLFVVDGGTADHRKAK